MSIRIMISLQRKWERDIDSVTLPVLKSKIWFKSLNWTRNSFHQRGKFQKSRCSVCVEWANHRKMFHKSIVMCGLEKERMNNWYWWIGTNDRFMTIQGMDILLFHIFFYLVSLHLLKIVHIASYHIETTIPSMRIHTLMNLFSSSMKLLAVFYIVNRT